MVVNTIDITLPNYGTIRGSVDIRRQIAIFRNVPFAHAPVRWRVAVKPQRWTGIRDGTIQGPVPPHIPTDNLQIDLIPKEYTTIGTSTNSLHQFGVEHSEEGGLNSNIFVPLSALQEGAASVPVLAFIYGGSYRTGSNAFPLYDARNFVEHSVQLGQPIIVVVPNYRMAAFGFLASKELQQDIDQHIQQSPAPIPAYDQSIGNWGLQDQKLAFEWIRENISEFGGDAKNVAAFGQSVGAISLHYHIVLPAHHGLFDRAILQSGAIGTMSTGTVEQIGQPIFDRLVEILGIPADLSGVEKVRRLREVPVEELTRASDEAGLRFGYRPFHDGGKIFPFNIPVETWADSSFSYDPNLKAVLIGANKEEGYSLDNDFGERTLKTWPHLLNSFVPSPELVPLYEVAYGAPQIPTQATLNSHPSSGSMHGGELLFLFNPPMNETVFTPSELSAALEVQKRWISFAYRQPVLSDEGKATRAERDEAIVFTKEYKVEVGKERRLSEKVMGLWDAALEVRLKDIQASLDASVPKEE
ncbi:Alpha/Beta hydrolase protein [Linnemannia elongata]|nr:Alpha/Beta hydrolase protein [Linnemannia elongata]